MNEIRIITELSQEDRYRLDLIIQLLGPSLSPASAQACVSAAQHPVTDAPFDAAPAAADTPQSPAPDTTPAPAEKPAESSAEPSAPRCTRTDVQAAVIRLVNAGQKVQARQVIRSYADKVSALPEEVLDEVLQKLRQLEEQNGQIL